MLVLPAVGTQGQGSSAAVQLDCAWLPPAELGTSCMHCDKTAVAASPLAKCCGQSNSLQASGVQTRVQKTCAPPEAPPQLNVDDDDSDVVRPRLCRQPGAV